MKLFNLSKYKLPTKIFWCSMLCLSLLALGIAVFGSSYFSMRQFAVFFVALIISVLVTQHQFTIPLTEIKFTAKELTVFWATIWLGVPGGVLLAAVVYFANYKFAPKDKMQWLFAVYVNVISTLAAGSIFYLTLRYSTDFADFAAADQPIAIGWLTLAVTLMALTHYVLSSLLSSIFFRLEGEFSPDESSISEILRENFSWSPLNYLFGAVAAFALHFIFLKFGLYFGLVLLPLAVIGHLANKIYVARLAAKTKELTEASRVHLATVEALATAIDARDQVGIGHVRRTQIYAVGIGKNLGLSDDELKALNTGALLHDIGKLAVPDHILNKPGRLTPAEMEKIKIHAAVGASILERVNFSYPVVPTVKYHHEMWDGSGYPEKLKGDAIPLTARILSVADAYDTLRGARPYRGAVPRDEARRFVLNGSGAQFDPKIVDVFLRNLRKFETEIEEQGLSYTYGDSENDVHISTSERNSDQTYVEQIKRANREVFTLYELARVFSASLNLEETLSLFVDKIGELVPFDTCVVYLGDKTGEYAKTAYAAGKNSAMLKNKRVKAGEGATGYVLKKRQSVYNIEPGLDFSFHQIELIEEYSAMASLPLFVEETLLGAVSLYSCELENYEEEHMRLLETISRIASDAISVSLQHAESESRALTDPMTGLPNARSLQAQFEKEAGRASRTGSSFQLLMLDLDGFKAVNDTFGHKVGDRMLKEVSRVMRHELRDYDFLARYAGDEFVVIAPGTTDQDIQELCQRMQKAVSNFSLPVGDGRFASVGVSLGAACYPNHGKTLDQIVITADKAMYAAKDSHKQKIKATREYQMPVETKAAAAPPEELTENNLIVELDESHIISSAVN